MRANNDTQMTQTRKGAMHRRILCVTLTILSASLLLAACGEEQAPINQVEAYALPKTLFQGEWYYNKTVVDTPASRSIAWENMQGNFPNGLARIRWDIQENYLQTERENILSTYGTDIFKFQLMIKDDLTTRYPYLLMQR